MKIIDEIKANFFKDGTRELHLGKVITSIIVFSALIFFAVYKGNDITKKAKDRKEHLKYTIGITDAKNNNFKSSKPTVIYYYKVLEKEYEHLEHIDANYEKNVLANGGRYYVEFSSTNPSNGKLLLGYPVPDTIITAPSDGWTYMPGYGGK